MYTIRVTNHKLLHYIFLIVELKKALSIYMSLPSSILYNFSRRSIEISFHNNSLKSQPFIGSIKYCLLYKEGEVLMYGIPFWWYFPLLEVRSYLFVKHCQWTFPGLIYRQCKHINRWKPLLWLYQSCV